MVTIVEGDLFKSDAKIICHQVNCQGVMGSGVALQVKQKYPDAYKAYKQFCETFTPKELLGKVRWANSNDKIIGNLFAQENYGYDGNCYTSYDALQKCFDNVKTAATSNNNATIAMPYIMSCHRGGGDWNIVYKMIEDTFKDCNVVLYKRGE